MRQVMGVVVAAAAFAGTAEAATFDPALQGPFAANFSYGYVDAGGFTAYTAANYATGGGCQITTGASSSCLQGGPSNFLGVYFTPVDGQAATAFLFASDVSLHPGAGDQQAAVVFNAPRAGAYTFAGLLRSVDAPAGNGFTYSLAGTISGLLSPAGSVNFSTTQTLAAGQQVFFQVGNNGSYSFDTTGLQLTVTGPVPEPATWAMMIGGFGVAGAAMRRRRSVSVRYA